MSVDGSAYDNEAIDGLKDEVLLIWNGQIVPVRTQKPAEEGTRGASAVRSDVAGRVPFADARAEATSGASKAAEPL